VDEFLVGPERRDVRERGRAGRPRFGERVRRGAARRTVRRRGPRSERRTRRSGGDPRGAGGHEDPPLRARSGRIDRRSRRRTAPARSGRGRRPEPTRGADHRGARDGSTAGVSRRGQLPLRVELRAAAGAGFGRGDQHRCPPRLSRARGWPVERDAVQTASRARARRLRGRRRPLLRDLDHVRGVRPRPGRGDRHRGDGRDGVRCRDRPAPRRGRRRRSRLPEPRRRRARRRRRAGCERPDARWPVEPGDVPAARCPREPRPIGWLRGGRVCTTARRDRTATRDGGANVTRRSQGDRTRARGCAN